MNKDFLRNRQGESTLELPEMVILQALKDIRSKDKDLSQAVRRRTLFWLLDGGGWWKQFTALDIRNLYLMTITGELELSKAYQYKEKRRNVTRRKKNASRKAAS